MSLLKIAAVPLTDFLKFPRFSRLLHTTLSSRTISHSTTPRSLNPLHKAAPPINHHHLPCSTETPLRAFIDLLKSSSRNLATLSEVELLHCRAMKAGFSWNGRAVTSLLGLYVKCGSLELAQKLFDEIYDRGTVAWTMLISGYSQIGQYEMGLVLVSQMMSEGTLPNHFTLASVLKCCMGLDDLRKGKEVHGWILRNGVRLDVALENSIIDLYAKCGAFGYAERVFTLMTKRDTLSWNIMMGAHLQIGDTFGSMELFRRAPVRDVSSWNTIIMGHFRNGSDMTALKLLYEMVETGPTFNQITFSIASVLASSLALLELGKQIHSQILRNGLELDEFIRNSLIDMYCKCGKMETSSVIFNSLSLSAKKLQGLASSSDGSKMAKTISWSSMISGYVQNGRSAEALDLFRRMLHEGVKVDQFTLTSIVAACSDAGILEQGRQVHACVEKLGHALDIFLASAIVDMYAQCGSLEDAHKTFESIKSENVVFWSSVIGSYASHGQGREAIRLFERMLEEKIVPNEISFVGVLSACSHGGLVEEGYKYFTLMQDNYGIAPSIEHITCMVDLLGRAGLLDEAKDFICENKISHHSVAWRALLSACRVHNNVEMAVLALEQVVRIEPCDTSSYVLLSNIYATKRQWMEASKLWSLMQDSGVRRQPGQSWIQLKN